MNTRQISRREALLRGIKYTAGTALGFQLLPSTTLSKGIRDVPHAFNVMDFGAAGNGQEPDTEAINRAIAAASEAGGGTVWFPAGTYLSFSIHLKSDVAVFIDRGATVLAADHEKHKKGYDSPEPNPTDMYQDFGHSHWHNSFMWGENLENISILGPGTIDGRGLGQWDRPDEKGAGNKAIALKNCRNIIIRDLTFYMGGHFCILASGTDNMTINNLTIDTNRDGINVDACQNVRISNCTVNSPNDDAIVLKSSYALGKARITKNITITNCQVTGYDPGTLLDGTYQRNQEEAPDHGGVTGRIKFGTESNGGFQNITISNCVFERSRGLALETVDGGLLEDIVISNITMRDITNSPFFLRLGSRMRGPEGVPVGKMHRITISNVIVHNADPRYGSLIMGIPGHYIEDISFNNIKILVKGGAPAEQAIVEVPELEDGYPDPRMFEPIPAYGFFIRHVKDIEMNNVEVSYMEEDRRPPFILYNVKGAEFNNMEAEHAKGVPAFRLNKVTDFSIRNSGPLSDVRLRKTDSRKIY